MDNHEKENELHTHRLDLQVKISESDRAALDFVKSMPEFKVAYPQYAEEWEEAVAEEKTVIENLAEWEFHLGEWVNADDTVVKDGIRYTVLQGHYLQADWVPGEVPALYRREADPGDEWPEFVQPTGAHDAYKKGDKVTFEGQHYVSLIDANVWSPAAYPQGWEKHE